MPELTLPADRTADHDSAVLRRRGFLRGSALLAAAAGGAVAATAGSVLPASAAPVQFFTLTIGVPPERLLDTRTSEGRTVIVASSSSALDSKHRLKKGAWIDVAVAKTVEDEELDLVSVFVNLKSLDSTSGGSLVVSSPGDKPTGTTITFSKGKTTTNSAIVGLGTVEDSYVVRIFATATGHVTLDVTGATIVYGDFPSSPDGRRSGNAIVERVAKAVRAAGR